MYESAPPLSFTVDVDGGLFGALQEGDYNLSTADFAHLLETKVGRHIEEHAGLYSACDDEAGIVRHGAFVAAAYCAADAFGRSDLPEKFQTAIHRQFVLAALPGEVLKVEGPEKEEVSMGLAEEAYIRHPEAQDIGALLVRKTQEMGCPEEVQQASLAGFGYMLDRLDACWAKAREGICARMAQEEFGLIENSLGDFSW